MTILPKLIGWVLIFYCGYCIFVFLLQRSILFPRNQIPNPTNTGIAIPGLEKTWLDMEFGKTETWYLPPVSGSRAKPLPAVIFGHGNGELIDYWPEALQNFNRMGIGLLLVEYPGYGRSSGTPSQKSISAAFVAAYDALVSREDVDSSRIILLGRSLGGGAVCALARQRPSAALILMSTFTSVHSMAAKFLAPKFLIRDPFNNLEVIKGYEGPVLVIHGQDDRIVPFAHGANLHRAAQGSRLITYESGHNDCPPDWDQFWKDIALFLTDNKIISSDNFG
jgi:pimeloyl-ACP methyl ester carboxylesterase